MDQMIAQAGCKPEAPTSTTSIAGKLHKQTKRDVLSRHPHFIEALKISSSRAISEFRHCFFSALGGYQYDLSSSNKDMRHILETFLVSSFLALSTSGTPVFAKNIQFYPLRCIASHDIACSLLEMAGCNKMSDKCLVSYRTPF